MITYEFKRTYRNREVYKLNHTHKWLVWLQRLCFWILNKLGCKHTEIDAASGYDRKEENILAKINEQANRACHDGFDPKYLLIGRNQVMELAEQLRTVDIYCQWCTTDDGKPMEVFGLKVFVVPWMTDCFAVIPDLAEEFNHLNKMGWKIGLI